MKTVKSTRHSDFKWATKLNHLILDAIGIWPTAHKNAFDKFLTDMRSLLAFLLLVFIAVIPAVHSLVRTWSDKLIVADNLQLTLPSLTSAIKLVIIRWKKTDLTSAINMIAKDWTKVQTDKEMHIMIKRAHCARILTMIASTLMFIGYTAFVVTPCLINLSMRYITNVTDPENYLLYRSYYLYDTHKSPNFELTIAVQIITGYVASASYTGVDTLFGFLIFHLCGQMENLKEKILNMKGFETFNEDLIFIVKDHIRLIRYFNVIERTFTLLLLGLLLYFGILFCLNGFLVIAILKEGKEISLIRLFLFGGVVITAIVHMCLFCAVGEILISQCENVHHAVYECDWYKLKPNEAKTLILIMIRAKKPLYFTAGKMFPVTMSMFCNLLKTSAGYVSVLLAMRS